MDRYRIDVPDRQLACAPIPSTEGRRYLGAMGAAANFASANRQIMMSLATRTFEHVLGVPPRELGASLLYDVCHNVAKLERHRVDGRTQTLCVHRKGATELRAGSSDVPTRFATSGNRCWSRATWARLLRAGRHGACDERDVRVELPWRGSSTVARRSEKGGAWSKPRRRSCMSGASRRSHTAGSRSPKRCPRPTKTYPRWSR